MPYQHIEDLPPHVREHLPDHAQEIYRAAYNHAMQEYQEPQTRKTAGSLEEIAHKVAWAAVKREYHKESECWVKNKKEATHGGV